MAGRDSAPLTDAEDPPTRSVLVGVIELLVQALALGAVLWFALAMPSIAERLFG